MKILGYILSVAGLAVIALSNIIAKISFLAKIEKALLYIILAGIVLVVLGIAFIMGFSSSTSSSKVKHAAEEVPIYEGEGKKRRIVGYRKERK
jgi:hypothetical protein